MINRIAAKTLVATVLVVCGACSTNRSGLGGDAGADAFGDTNGGGSGGRGAGTGGNGTGGVTGTGGGSTGGTVGTGGDSGTGGRSGTGGASATGGRSGTGGASATGGRSGSGGASATGGRSGTGGDNGTGGRSGTGGVSATGGRSGTGGASATGGRAGTGGGGAGGGPGLFCGGIAGFVCPEFMFCQHPAGQCDAPDASGTCVALPVVCTEIYAPVCGCDGHTYDNDCMRQGAGVSKRADDACNPQGCPNAAPTPGASCPTAALSCRYVFPNDPFCWNVYTCAPALTWRQPAGVCAVASPGAM